MSHTSFDGPYRLGKYGVGMERKDSKTVSDMTFAVDVTYDDQTAFVAVVLFDKWDDNRLFYKMFKRLVSFMGEYCSNPQMCPHCVGTTPA